MRLAYWVMGLMMITAGCGSITDEWSTAEAGLKACPKATTLQGIDVSKWQGSINWFSVASAGIEFAFIRVSDGLNYKDQYFQTNWQDAYNVGIVRGAYQYFRPGQDPVAQANLLLQKMGPLLEGDLPPVVDIETDDGMSTEVIISRLQTWLNTVENALGVKPIIYTMPGFWAKINTPAFGSYPLWIAHWGVSCPTMPTGWNDWVFWQTSDSGSVAGIAGPVDTNLFNGNKSELLAFAVGQKSCDEGCQVLSNQQMAAIEKINTGWIGGACNSDASCNYAGGFCVPGPPGAQGMCSQGCDKFCPDQPGKVVTFCVASNNIGVNSPPGTCVAKCDFITSPSGCRPGYVCVELPRFNDPATKDLTCVPQFDANAIDPLKWSAGYTTDNCTFEPCALDFGQACTNDGGGPQCAFAVCLDPDTYQINQGVSCSYLGSTHGTSVTCDSKGKLLKSETCSALKPCNACGTCGKLQEVCDGKDNDCDGLVDEGLNCGTEPPPEPDVQSEDTAPTLPDTSVSNDAGPEPQDTFTAPDTAVAVDTAFVPDMASALDTGVPRAVDTNQGPTYLEVEIEGGNGIQEDGCQSGISASRRHGLSWLLLGVIFVVCCLRARRNVRIRA